MNSDWASDGGRPVRPRAGWLNHASSMLPEKLRRLIFGTHALALADQAVVSGTSFVTTVLIARWSGPAELAAYAIAISVLTSVLAVQNALVLEPFQIQRPHHADDPAGHAGSSLALSGMISGLFVLVLAAAALLIFASGGGHQLVAMTWAVAGLTPFVLTREFARRFSFARLKVAHALGLDLGIAALQIVMLVGLGLAGIMSSEAACLTIALASAVCASGWLIFSRRQFSVDTTTLGTVARRSWGLGKWLLAGRITVQVQGYITYWLSIVIAGAEVTGIYAACMSVVAFANPLMFGIANVMMPHSVMAWKNGGGPGLLREAGQQTALLGAVLGVFTIAIALVGDPLMQLLFHGPEFLGRGATLDVLALALFVLGVGMPASNALASMERPRAIVAVAIGSATVTVVLVWWLLTAFGLIGAAIGYLTGNLCGTVGRWVAFLALVPKRSEIPTVTRVLERLTGDKAQERWEISPIGQGDDASVFAVTCRTGTPLWQGHEELVIKLYKSERGLTRDMVAAQSAKLSELNTALDNIGEQEWCFSAPRPLHLCDDPLALVMTAAAGTHIDACNLPDDGSADAHIAQAAEAFASAMAGIWAEGQLHGDLGLRNILFDFDYKRVALIDGGTLESCQTCNMAPAGDRAAALDLSHMLWELATDVTDVIGDPAESERRQVFIETVLAAASRASAGAGGSNAFLAAIREGFYAHLDETLTAGLSPRGIWHKFVRRFAVNRAEGLLADLAAGAETETEARP